MDAQISEAAKRTVRESESTILTLAELLEAYSSCLLLADPSTKTKDLVKNTRSTANKYCEAACTLTQVLLLTDLTTNLERYNEVLSRTCSPGSLSAHLSRMRALLTWAALNNQIAADEDRVVQLGFPGTAGFVASLRDTHARSFSLKFLRVCSATSLPAREVRERHVETLLSTMANEEYRQRAGSAFRRHWNLLVQQQLLLGAKCLKEYSKASEDYGARLDDLPQGLQDELESLEEILRNPKPRTDCTPLDCDARNLCRNYVLLLIGYLTQMRQHPLAHRTLAELITADNVVDFIEFSNSRGVARALAKFGAGSKTGSNGYTEVTIARQMKVVAKRYLNDAVLTDQFSVLERKLKANLESRREAYKRAGPLDQFFYVAHQLLLQSDEPGRRGFGRKDRAILRRDALLLVIMATFAFRRRICAELTLNNIDVEDGGVPVLKVSRSDTKPEKRDLWQEVPEEFRFLFFHYLQVERQVLLGGKSCSNFFLTEDGHPMSPEGITQMFARRCPLILGYARNPHQVRKSWFTGFLDWSGNDYLNATLVGDASQKVIDTNYRETDASAQIETRFDPFRNKAAIDAQAWLQEMTNAAE